VPVGIGLVALITVFGYKVFKKKSFQKS
jgi:hypothetical protein